jgi:hypothetical protein
MRILRQKNEQIHFDPAIECKLYNSPHCREHSLRKYKYSSIHEERRANQLNYKRLGCDIYNLFSNLLARGILGSLNTYEDHECGEL